MFAVTVVCQLHCETHCTETSSPGWFESYFCCLLANLFVLHTCHSCRNQNTTSFSLGNCRTLHGSFNSSSFVCPNTWLTWKLCHRELLFFAHWLVYSLTTVACFGGNVKSGDFSCFCLGHISTEKLPAPEGESLHDLLFKEGLSGFKGDSTGALEWKELKWLPGSLQWKTLPN